MHFFQLSLTNRCLSSLSGIYIPQKCTKYVKIHFCFLQVLGLVGNFLVCFAVWRNPHMRTVTNYFIVNLALADFMVCLICLPPTVIGDVTETWYMGNVMCKIVQYLQVSQYVFFYYTACSHWAFALAFATISVDVCRYLPPQKKKKRNKIKEKKRFGLRPEAKNSYLCCHQRLLKTSFSEYYCTLKNNAHISIIRICQCDLNYILNYTHKIL